jgi:hypothetical protein
VATVRACVSQTSITAKGMRMLGVPRYLSSTAGSMYLPRHQDPGLVLSRVRRGRMYFPGEGAMVVACGVTRLQCDGVSRCDAVHAML